MRILVVSDSHGAEEYLYTVLYEEDYDAVVHCGDGAETDFDLALADLPKFSGKPLYRVKGNCDFFSALPTTIFENIGGHKFYITHGHMQHVKSGTAALVADARASGRDIVLYGHTHRQDYELRDGITVVNPGSLKNGYYAVVTIVGDDVSVELK